MAVLAVLAVSSVLTVLQDLSSFGRFGSFCSFPLGPASEQFCSFAVLAENLLAVSCAQNCILMRTLEVSSFAVLAVLAKSSFIY